MNDYLRLMIEENLMKEAEEQFIEDLIVGELIKEAAEERRRSILPYALGGMGLAGLGAGGYGIYRYRPDILERIVTAPERAYRSIAGRLGTRAGLRAMGEMFPYSVMTTIPRASERLFKRITEEQARLYPLFEAIKDIATRALR